MADVLGLSRATLRQMVRGDRPMPLHVVRRAAELARERSAALAALAVRLETVDRPILEERRRIVRQRSRERFLARFGYYPEENQVLRRQRPPS